MNPPCFAVNSGSGFIAMNETKCYHALSDFLVSIRKNICTSGHHVLDGSGSQWNIKYTAKNFMSTVYADSTNSIKCYNKSLYIFSILHSCFDILWKCSLLITTVHRTVLHKNKFMCNDINGKICIQFKTCFFYTCFFQT